MFLRVVKIPCGSRSRLLLLLGAGLSHDSLYLRLHVASPVLASMVLVSASNNGNASIGVTFRYVRRTSFSIPSMRTSLGHCL